MGTDSSPDGLGTEASPKAMRHWRQVVELSLSVDQTNTAVITAGLFLGCCFLPSMVFIVHVRRS